MKMQQLTIMVCNVDQCCVGMDGSDPKIVCISDELYCQLQEFCSLHQTLLVDGNIETLDGIVTIQVNGYDIESNIIFCNKREFIVSEENTKTHSKSMAN